MARKSIARMNSVFPYLIVSNLEETLAVFRSKLGFEVVNHEPEIGFAVVNRDEVAVLLRQTDKDPRQLVNAQFHREDWPQDMMPYDISIQVTDLEAYHRELTERGANPTPLTARPYGRDLSVTLPDGYSMVFLELAAEN